MSNTRVTRRNGTPREKQRCTGHITSYTGTHALHLFFFPTNGTCFIASRKCNRKRRRLPEDVATAVVDGLGHQAHQAAAPAAVDEVELPLHLRKASNHQVIEQGYSVNTDFARYERCTPTISFPRSSAAALKDARFPDLLPQKTQTVRTRLGPPPLLSELFS